MTRSRLGLLAALGVIVAELIQALGAATFLASRGPAAVATAAVLLAAAAGAGTLDRVA